MAKGHPGTGFAHITLEALMTAVSPCPITGCWWWLGSFVPAGRAKVWGRFRGRSNTWLVHRLLYELTIGLIADGLCACHRCDNGHLGCVNPSHLFLGTKSENNSDRHRKGRDARGSTHGSTVLPEAFVVALPHLRGLITQRRLAELAGCAPSTIAMIQTGRNWRHLLA